MPDISKAKQEVGTPWGAGIPPLNDGWTLGNIEPGITPATTVSATRPVVYTASTPRLGDANDALPSLKQAVINII